MTKTKIIGISVAAFGVVASVGAAFAIYVAVANNVEIDISGDAYTGSTSEVTYKITNAVEGKVAPQYFDGEGHEAEEGKRKLSPETTQLKYAFTLGGQFANDLPAQSYLMGNVSVSLTNVKPALYNKVQVYAAMENYEEGKLGKAAFGGAIIDNVTIENAETTCAGNASISVEAAGVQSLVVWVKLVNCTAADYLAFNEADGLFNLSVTWKALDSEYVVPAVVGDHTAWNADDEFAMAVDVKAEVRGDSKWTWAYNGLKGSDFSEAKVKKGDEYSAGDNAQLEAEKVYDVSWVDGEQAVFTARS